MGVEPRAPASSRPSAHRIRFVLLELLWLAGSVLLASLLTYYLHESWQPWTSLIAAFIGGLLLRWLLHSNFARFPIYLRFNFELGVALVGVLVASWATLVLYPAPYWVLRWRPAVALPVIAVMLGLALAAMRAQQTRFERSVAELRDRENELREQTLRSQLRALQAQINPHFLFNALNALAELTQVDAAAAEIMVQDLSHLLRYSLRSSSVERIPLSQELEAVDRYLRIEQTRLGERLRVSREIDEGLEAVLVPGLILQPLVENAVRHAIVPREDGGTLTLVGRREGDALLLGVADDGPGLPAQLAELLAHGPGASRDEDGPDGRGSEGAGGGLANVLQRLELAYRGAASLRYHEQTEGGSRLELRLPWTGDRN